MALKIPPVILLAITATAMWITDNWLPFGGRPPLSRWWLVAALLAIGISAALAGVAAFQRAATTVNPMAPERASVMVTSGIYRVSRNPMYLGMLLVLIAWATVLWSPLSLLWSLVFFSYMNHFQIAPEEQALRARFGVAFENYSRTVRRWL
jgi:protein-S-isoprenylcysteine O-methyltransferase Ste14